MVDRVAKQYWMNIAANAAAQFPGNGEGSTTITARIATVPATTLYTAKTNIGRASVTDAASNPGAAGVVKGDYIVTTGGYYGVVDETPAAGAGVTVFVKDWHLPHRLMAAGVISKPADATGASIFPPVIVGDYEHVRIVRFTPATAGTFILGDQRGTAFMSYIVAAGGIGSTVELGIDIDSPFTMLSLAGTCIVVFEGYN